MESTVKPRILEITFSVRGCVKQTIELKPDCPYTDEEIVEMLNEGRIATSIHENENVLDYGSNDTIDTKSIGKVDNVENNFEYSNYESN